jgi:hypothetical protein
MLSEMSEVIRPTYGGQLVMNTGSDKNVPLFVRGDSDGIGA